MKLQPDQSNKSDQSNLSDPSDPPQILSAAKSRTRVGAPQPDLSYRSNMSDLSYKSNLSDPSNPSKTSDQNCHKSCSQNCSYVYFVLN